MSTEPRIAFIGTGKMATAFARGLINSKTVAETNIIGSDASADATRMFRQETGATIAKTNRDAVDGASVVFVAVKPGQVADVLREVQAGLVGKLVISIAAGIALRQIEEVVPGARVIRVMPNTPAVVNASASAYALGVHATQEDADLCERLLGSVGTAMRVKEELLDAITGLSGSGPAYVFLFIEALSDGGVAAGLPRDQAMRLAAQTVFGAAKMVLETKEHPAVLKDMVASPGGTTIEGIHSLERGGFRASVISAVRAAADKSRSLSKG